MSIYHHHHFHISWISFLMWSLNQTMGWSTKAQAAPSTSDPSSAMKPPAGLTMPRSDKSLVFSSLSDSTCGMQNTWCECDATTFQLRSGPDYSKNKFKTSSLAALYEAVAVE